MCKMVPGKPHSYGDLEAYKVSNIHKPSWDYIHLYGSTKKRNARITNMTTEDCIEACLEKRKTNSRLNGIVVYKPLGECFCVPEMSQASNRWVLDDKDLYKSCFLAPPTVNPNSGELNFNSGQFKIKSFFRRF